MFLALFYIISLLFLFYILAKICDEYFVKSLDMISNKFKLPEDVAGATFMAIGTSAPEFFTSVIALTKVGSENIGAGTIVGSAIFNILVIVGGAAIVSTAFLSWRPVLRDMLFYSIAIVILLFTFRDGVINMAEAFSYLVAYGFYIFILVNWKNWFPEKKKFRQPEEIVKSMKEEDKYLSKNKNFFSKILLAIDELLSIFFPDLNKKPNLYWVTFIISILFIIAASYGLVEAGIGLAKILGIPEVIIALTILAGGTSVPDLISSLIVAKKGRGDMAVSNAVGSNSFDIMIGLGLPWFVFILLTGKPITVATENLTSSIILLFFTVISILFVLSVQRFKLGRKSGYFLIVLYVCYLLFAIFSAFK